MQHAERPERGEGAMLGSAATTESPPPGPEKSVIGYGSVIFSEPDIRWGAAETASSALVRGD
ncbi:hypothetical protein GCM10015535_59420 [Streptomyces gelaticus]|uniref:Uncharacterized protein n=1 Tax=Streptomyces gelaticus TaxID=285446 RepID=A0ABQ2W9E0_9ACTN|nr:hypothetical protein GCM10015535_59420 [Streptomyces gelaticus]